MLLKIKKEVEETVEVELPVFLKTDYGTFYKQGEEGYIEVKEKESGKLKMYGIEVSNGYTLPNSFFSYPQIPEAVFNNVYQKALSEITRQAFLSSGISTPATDEQKREHVYEDQEVRTLENVIE